ncbi:hypothetical protein C8J56DRAFT_886268 [Mycena floridula]|nr:hypothetical protein C8J56DRAFT_886268 [Mycena floridula]
MGRPRKYETEAERQAAVLANKRAYYHRNSERLQREKRDSYHKRKEPQTEEQLNAMEHLMSQPQVAFRRLRLETYRLEREFTKLKKILGLRPLPTLVRFALRQSSKTDALDVF